MINIKYYRHNSGLYIPEQPKRPTAIDLFCGCGGFSLGLLQAGFEVLAGVDYDEWAAITYMTNLGSYPINIHYIAPEDKDRLCAAIEEQIERNKKNSVYSMSGIMSGLGWIKSERQRGSNYPGVKHFWLGDIRKLSGKEILKTLGMDPGEVDCVVGGPPCQGFSRAGKREVMDPRNSLVFEFARMILEIQPKTFVFENVPGIIDMVTPEGIPVLEKFCLILEEGGFGTVEALEKTLKMSAAAGIGTKFKPQEVKEDNDMSKSEPEKLSLF